MAEDTIARFGVSLSRPLLKQLDQMVRQKGYRNRSLAIAAMVREQLVAREHDIGNGEVAGTITLVFDHHRSNVQEVLTSLQHDHLAAIVSTLHVHLDHANCLEVLVVRGRAAVLRRMAENLLAVRGIKHGKLTLTTTGHDLPA